MGFFDRMGNLGKGLINTLSDSEEQDHVKDLKRRAREAALDQEIEEMRERGTWRQRVPEASDGTRQRSSDLAAEVLKELVKRNNLDTELVDDVIFGRVSQTGEQSVNVARNAVLAAVKHGLGARPRNMAHADVLACHHEILHVSRIETAERNLVGFDRYPGPMTEPEIVFVAWEMQAKMAAVCGHRIRKLRLFTNIVFS